jgi:hypothetical protein
VDSGRAGPAAARPWHALLGPLPADAIPRRRPVGSPEVLATPEGAAIAGWEQLTVELSAGAAGLRVAMVVLDATGRPISAGDSVLYRSEVVEGGGADAGQATEWVHESVGGRLELDGTFRGTRWHTVGVERPGEEEPRLDSTRSEPSAADITGLKALVAEILRRCATAGEGTSGGVAPAGD